jgi:hypothetical protein
MARKKGSKRARYFAGGIGNINLPNFSPERLAEIRKAVAASKKTSTGSTTSRADQAAQKAKASTPSKPAGIAAGSLSTAAIANQQEAKKKAIADNLTGGGAKSARDFAPNVPGAGTAYTPPQAEAAVMPDQVGSAIQNITPEAQKLVDTPVVKDTGPLTDEKRQEQEVTDKRSREILKAAGVTPEGLSPEEYNASKEKLGAWLNLPENRAYRDTSTAVGKIVDKLGGPAGLFALTAGGILLAGGALGGAGSAAAGGGATGGGAAAAEAAALAQAGVPSSALAG